MNAQVEPILESSVDIGLAEQSLRLAKRKQRWAACRDFYAPIIAAFQRMGVEPSFDGDDYITVTMTGDKEKLAKAFRILRGAGFTFTAERPKKGDSSWYAFFHHADCDTTLFLNFTSSVCRRVKVGTEMKEVDIYETQCGDISVDEPPMLTVVPTSDAVQFDQDIPF